MTDDVANLLQGNAMKCILIAAATTLAAGAADAQVRLTANCHAAASHVMCAKIMPAWIEAVDKATEGRVKITRLAKSMAPAPDQLVSVRSGVFDVAIQFNGFIAEDIVGPAVALQPFTGTVDARANSVALWRTYEKFLAGADEYEGVHLLGLWSSPGADFYSMTDTPIDTMAGLSRKMWGLPGVTSGILKDAGSAAVSGPAQQMTEIIQRGVVDGFVGIAASDVISFNVVSYARSVTRTTRKIYAPNFSFIIGDAAWAQIDPADQAAITAVSGEALAEMAGEIWKGEEDAALAVIDSTMQVVTASAEFESALDLAAAPYIEQWKAAAAAKGIDADEALAFYMTTVAELTAADME